MKKVVFIIIGLLVARNVDSQKLMPTILDTIPDTREISLDASAELSSTAINNAMINRFLFGGEIENSVLQGNIAQQKSLNRVGAILSGNLMYKDFKTDLFKNPKIGFGVQLGYERISNISYTDQLFGLLFQGNEQYAGDDIKLNSTSVSDISYQKMGFGILLKKTKSYGFINLVNLSNFTKGAVRHGTIQQSDDIDLMTFDLEGQLTHPNSPAFSKGAGISIDFKYNIPLKIFKNKNARLSAQISNLGFAYMYMGTNKYNIDTIMEYNGFSFGQLKNGIKGTSLMDTLGIKEGEGTKWIGLPFSVQISKEVNEDFEGKVQSLFGIRVYPISNYRPLVYLGCDFKPISHLHIGLIASYGGFSSFRGSLYVQYRVKGFGFGLATDNIIGMVAKKGYGQTYNMRLSWVF